MFFLFYRIPEAGCGQSPQSLINTRKTDIFITWNMLVSSSSKTQNYIHPLIWHFHYTRNMFFTHAQMAETVSYMIDLEKQDNIGSAFCIFWAFNFLSMLPEHLHLLCVPWPIWKNYCWLFFHFLVAMDFSLIHMHYFTGKNLFMYSVINWFQTFSVQRIIQFTISALGRTSSIRYQTFFCLLNGK